MSNFTPEQREEIATIAHLKAQQEIALTQSNGWAEYRRLVLAELERAASDQKSTRDLFDQKHTILSNQLVEQRVEAAKAGAFWGAVSSIAIAVIGALGLLVKVLIESGTT